MTDEDYSLAKALAEAIGDTRAWTRGEMPLETVTITPMPPERVKAIRRKVASSARAFEARFGIPAATLNNWEQGRREPDVAARLLLRVIEREPELVEAAARMPDEGVLL